MHMQCMWCTKDCYYGGSGVTFVVVTHQRGTLEIVLHLGYVADSSSIAVYALPFKLISANCQKDK